MIRINQIKLKTSHTEEELKKKLLSLLGLKEGELLAYHIHKKSLDARRKPQLFYVYTVDVKVRRENDVMKRFKKSADIRTVTDIPYAFPLSGTKPLLERPVIIGSGPAGLTCAYMLAQNGYRPVLIERGAPVEERMQDVEAFWQTGCLKPDSNVQFGEGGAGTFSDGKLNTLVKDPKGRNRKVLELFIEHGAPDEIAYINKPHVGTDKLCEIVRSMRNTILANGGDVYFHKTLTGLQTANGQLTGIALDNGQVLKTNTLVLAIGHSARDTFEMLNAAGIAMEAKSFAVGLRIEHPQQMIDEAQYGQADFAHLPAADYKLTTQLDSGRGVYTFCMCPGGYVVNASSEAGHLAVNGMSYHARDGVNANSAVVVTVSPDDYGSDHPLAGVGFQRQLEERAYQAGKGKVPIQCFADFCQKQKSSALGEVTPQIKGEYVFGELHHVFPTEIYHALCEGIKKLDAKLRGFSRPDAVLSAVESRTSSPVRIVRSDSLQSNIKGVYPCGEGAGYAGGITSAAMDGLKVAEMIAEEYHSFD